MMLSLYIMRKNSISQSSRGKSKNKNVFLLCQTLKKDHDYWCKLYKLSNHQITQEMLFSLHLKQEMEKK